VGGTRVGDESDPSSSAAAAPGLNEERERVGLGARTLADVGNRRGRDEGVDASVPRVRAERRLVSPVAVAAVRLAEDVFGRAENGGIQSGAASDATLDARDGAGFGVVSRGRRAAKGRAADDVTGRVTVVTGRVVAKAGGRGGWMSRGETVGSRRYRARLNARQWCCRKCKNIGLTPRL
jgi:hypothetical protein